LLHTISQRSLVTIGSGENARHMADRDGRSAPRPAPRQRRETRGFARRRA